MAPRIPLLENSEAAGRTSEIYSRVQEQLGMVPNLYRVMGHSPAALSAYLAMNEHLASSSLSGALREKIALAVSQRNRCGYCLSAHTMIATGMEGVPEAEAMLARDGRGRDQHETALLELAGSIVDRRGWIGDEALDQARTAGVTNSELVEIVALVATLTFSNYMNHLAHTPLDFPAAQNLPAEGPAPRQGAEGA